MNKKIWFLCLVLLISLSFFIYLGIAGITVNYPVKGGNYSSTMTVNCTTDIVRAKNASIYYNVTGGPVSLYSPRLITISNDTADDKDFTSTSVDISGLTSARTYNFSCYIVNGTGTSWEGNWSVAGANTNITIDNTPPLINLTRGILANGTGQGANLSSTVVLNFTVNDTLMDISACYFNISTRAYVQQSFVQATKDVATFDETYCNYSLDTTGLSDGKYIIYAYVNDSLGNINRTESIDITIDNNAPSVSLGLEEAGVDSITVTITALDSGTGIKGLCTSSRSGATITGEGASTQTLTETGLDAGVTYEYTVTCYDYKGHSGSATASYATTSGTSVSGTTGGVSGKTYVPSSEQVEEGYTKKVSEDDKFKVTIENKEHQIIVDSVSENAAMITISDVGQEEVAVGEEKKLDITGDGWYDISIKLNSIEGEKADITIKAIHEKVVEEEKKPAEEKGVAAEKAKALLSSLWFWVVIIIIVVAIIAYITYSKKK